MTTRIAFLRAVNVGKRTVSNARLVELAAAVGYDGGWTHVNSGNLVVDVTGRRETIEKRLEDALEGEFGFEVTTFVRSLTELRATLAAEPFAVAEGDTYFVTFLKTVPTAAQARDLEALSGDFDTLVVDGRDVHWLMHGKSTDTQVPSKDWAGVVGRDTSTSRNTTMLRRLVAKIEERS